MDNDVIIDDISAESMMLSVVGRSDIQVPEAEYESEYIEGRDGSVNRFLYYKDVEQTIEFNILEEFNIKSQIRKIKAWLLNAESFYFSDDQEIYRKIKTVKIDGIKNDIAEYGDFEVKFTCDPFEYVRNDKAVVATNGGNIDNIGTYKSLPVLTLYGAGDSTVTVNDQTFTMNLQKDYAKVDSDIMEVYFQNTNLGQQMTGDFPILLPGKNKISWTGGITKIEVERRCRYL